jgi:serine/threonine-protein kinase
VTEVGNDTVVDDRYTILHRIGSGGMADVYLAQDSHLGREVALKVLHRRFAQDTEFVERFRREASAAAGLQHPNVVGVFDRGEHEGTYYIAMEHLRGRTLKDLITQEAPLDQLRAIDLGVQILAAAAFAHKRGVIHRDFKPHNVIVDEGGHAKVTDFGIARAGASEMTETGSIMGTAQYLSPEQAQGQAVTAGSDIYSIGVVMFEMLTGKLPFDGDSAVSIALKHMQEPPPSMSALRPDLNPTLEQVVMGALAKDPRGRWQSADDFAEALEAARTHVEAGSNGGQDTAVFGALPAAAAAAAAGALAADPAEAADDGGASGPPPSADKPDESRKRPWGRYALAALVLALIAVAAYALTRPAKFDVPDVKGQQLTKARATLAKKGFENISVQRERNLAERDLVLRQTPPGGEAAPKKDKVTLVVSNGPGQNIVPSVRNLPKARAVRELKRAGFKVGTASTSSDAIKAGNAVRTSPAEGRDVERGATVTLFISSGPAKVTVPDLTGVLRSTAEARVESLGLTPKVTEVESDQREDEVLSQSPAGGTKVDPGGTVTITVAKAKQKVSVPDVTDMTQAQALRALRSAGLTGSARKRTVDDKSQDGKVVDQSPAAGVEVDKGKSVSIVVGKFKAPATPTTPTTPAPKPPAQ